ncbi:hypothetical protein [Anaeromyxobacter sp. PSR-1]|uniref:hypothetical protein n=1 Tax=Anaeromyxobacter sp. PSR-1 TaxID=1300915 RepID=UPI0005DE2F42|nr:hypothetical protein [Anaeromyxobacter sp. PSR-1]GAO01825.1 hypothetical protein PSR1_00686 [Anaeromyxobacter sp. PSR-1]
MTLAQERLATFAEWVVASSRDCTSPLGDRIIKGPYAIFVPLDLALAPSQTFATEHLPLWIPEQQVIPNLPLCTQSTPQSQGRRAGRLRHIVWSFNQGRFEGAILGLTDRGEPLQSVMERQAPTLDLATYPVLFAPLWDLDAETRTFLDRRLPVIRG